MGFSHEFNKESILSVNQIKHKTRCTYYSKSTIKEFILNDIRIAATVVVSNCINSSLSNSIYLRSFRLVLKRMVISFCSRNRLNI